MFYPLLVPHFPKDRPNEVVYPMGPATRLKEICQRLAEPPVQTPEWTLQLFPNGSMNAEDHLRLDIEQFRGPAAESDNGDVLPLIYACASYRSDDDGKLHQTGRVFSLFVRDDTQNHGFRHLRLNDLPVEPQNLVIRPFEIVGSIVS